MDWIDEKIGQFRKWIRNLSVKWALAAYLLLAFCGAFVCTWTIRQYCTVRYNELIQSYGIYGAMDSIKTVGSLNSIEEIVYLLPEKERSEMAALQLIFTVSPWICVGAGSAGAAVLFYRNRMRRPFEILRKGAEEMGRHNLDFTVAYDSKDEMGQLCRTFEQMRREVVADREALWRKIEDQKEINAVFAHDMRTPLTVLRGYSELLYRYAPEGKVSEEKLTSTLKLMSQQLKRLEDYTRTMRQIRSFEELEITRTETTKAHLYSLIQEITEPLNLVGDIRILTAAGGSDASVWLDESIFLEVLENLLSNALRFAGKEVEILLDYEQEQDRLFLYVRDDGPGFDTEGLASAAEPYFRGRDPEARAEETGGGQEHFGIGLHICRVLAEKHGGCLNLANSVEGGAFVSVSFFCRKS